MENVREGGKLLLSFDVIPEQMERYFRFFVGRYIPTMQAIGLEVSEAWHTAYGEGPDRLIGFICPELERALALPENENWLSLNEELDQFVVNFDYKIIRYKEGFQL